MLKGQAIQLNANMPPMNANKGCSKKLAVLKNMLYCQYQGCKKIMI